MDKIDKEEVHERSFPLLGQGTCMLEENLNEKAVKKEMVTLMVDLSKKKGRILSRHRDHLNLKRMTNFAYTQMLQNRTMIYSLVSRVAQFY